jgi:hypothetical protein
MKLRVALLGLAAATTSAACTAGPAARAPVAGAAVGNATSFLVGSLRPWPDADSPGLLAISDPTTNRVASYDSALVALALLRAGERERAGRILLGLAHLQTSSGGIAFSFTLPGPDPARPFERAGAIAWVGYAAVDYLDASADEPAAAARAAILALAHRAAGYLLERQVDRPGDPRDGLVLGGNGTIRYEAANEDVREVYDPGEVSWASVEHNVDTYFFLRALGRITGTRAYTDGAARIARALKSRAWSAASGQLVQGFGERGADEALALDCASWGSIFLGASGDRARADTALSIGDARYASHDPRSSARGHRPYAAGPLIENVGVRRHFAGKLPAQTWDRLDVVWPEGSAGVALAEWRAGHLDRAAAILDALEPLRANDGSLPTASVEVPFTFDTLPSVAGTAWVALVRFELARPEGHPTLWP